MTSDSFHSCGKWRLSGSGFAIFCMGWWNALAPSFNCTSWTHLHLLHFSDTRRDKCLFAKSWQQWASTALQEQSEGNDSALFVYATWWRSWNTRKKYSVWIFPYQHYTALLKHSPESLCFVPTSNITSGGSRYLLSAIFRLSGHLHEE